MAEFTKHYGLTKPDSSEFYNIAVFNENSDIVDGQIKQNADDISSHKTQISELKQQSSTFLPRGGITWGDAAGK